MKTKLLLAALALSLTLHAQQIQQAEFPYPAIPQTLRTPQERGAYLLKHYWDNFNFADTTLIHRPDITEQGFANFLDLLPRLDSTAAVTGVQAFADAAFAPGVPANVRTYFSTQTDHYLYDPNSPMHSDELYLLFGREMLRQTALDDATRERLAFRLKNVGKNMPGTPAADFDYIDRHGRRRTLYTTPGQYTLLYFNDPDCDNCHAVTRLLTADTLFTANPRLTILAVYPDATTEEWQRHPQPFPRTWIDAYSPDGRITTDLIYFIHAMPTLYLLDHNKRVILKDPSPEALKAYLQER